jgi:Ser/Thr protein kinase RdoA (MazF antagonist)
MSAIDFDGALATLIDAWCERRELKLLRIILGAYPRVSGLTDEWAELAKALKTIRAQHSSLLKTAEFETVVELLHIAEGIAYR